MKKETPTMDISVEWNKGIVRGFKSKQEAERFIERVCKKTAPNLRYCVYKYVASSTSKRENR